MYDYAFIVIVWSLLVGTLWFGPLPGAQYTVTKCVLVITLVGLLICSPSTTVSGLYAVWVALVILQGAMVQRFRTERYTEGDDTVTNRPTLTTARWGTHEDPKYSMDVFPLFPTIQRANSPVTTHTFLDAIHGVKQLRFQYPQPSDVFHQTASLTHTADTTDTMVVSYIVHEGDTIESKWIAYLQRPESYTVLDAPEFRVELGTSASAPSQTIDLTQVVQHALKHNIFGTIRDDLTVGAFFDYLFPANRTRLLYKTTAHASVVAAPSPLFLYHADPHTPGLLQQFSLPPADTMDPPLATGDTTTPGKQEDPSHGSPTDAQHPPLPSTNTASTSPSMPTFDRDCTDACAATVREMLQRRNDWTFVGTTIRRLEESTDPCDKACYAYWLAHFQGLMHRLEKENVSNIPEEVLQNIAKSNPLFHFIGELKAPLAKIRSQGAFQTITLSQMYDKVTQLMDNVDKPNIHSQMATELNTYLGGIVNRPDTNEAEEAEEDKPDTNRMPLSAEPVCLRDCQWSCNDKRFGNGEMTVYFCRGCPEDDTNQCRPGADGYGHRWSLGAYFSHQ